jgi:hypothetical protein
MEAYGINLSKYIHHYLLPDKADLPMSESWQNILIEIGLFIILGVLYYFYQKRKIIRYEENKGPIIMGFILQSCLSEKNEIHCSELDAIIESIDDYLHNRSINPPISLLRIYMNSPQCSKELSDVIREGLYELEEIDGKK